MEWRLMKILTGRWPENQEEAALYEKKTFGICLGLPVCSEGECS